MKKIKISIFLCFCTKSKKCYRYGEADDWLSITYSIGI
jgi:hypothetical protein